jgi:lipopolysaccharide transport system ATP-binding protein
MIYPTLYVTKEAFDARVKDRAHRRFVIVRDLRDTLVSAYFSMKVSHPMLGSDVKRLRMNLDSLSLDDGMIFMMDDWLPECAKIQVSWVEAGERLIRYEQLVAEGIELFEHVLLEEMELPVTRERFKAVVLANRFESVSGGRKPGEEDISSHHRKGVVGDWRNHFSPQLKEAFKARFGGLLVATGYERDLNW